MITLNVRPDSLFARHAEKLAPSATNSMGNDKGLTHQNFLGWIQSGIGQVDQLQQAANLQVEQMLLGEDVASAEVMTSLQKADMAFRLMVQIRNKLMDAYQEINNIRI